MDEILRHNNELEDLREGLESTRQSCNVDKAMLQEFS